MAIKKLFFKRFLGVVLLGVIGIGLGFHFGDASAAPAPYKVVVNDETKECALIFGGDECMDCFPPEGWKVLGYETQVQCPADYILVEVDYTCQPFKVEFCCTEGHSGAHGDCEDMVINKSQRLCAFVEDIEGCNLPSGWVSKPADTTLREWACPGKYQWTEDLACRPSEEGQPGSEGRIKLFQRLGVAEAIILAGGGIFCLASAAVIVAVGVVLLRKRKPVP